MTYRIVFEKPAIKFLLKQSRKQQERLLKAINQLPNVGDVKPLNGIDGVFRLRVGDYRVIYSIEHDMLRIKVLNIGNRGDIYKTY